MKKIISILDRILRAVIITATAGILAVICLQVFCRFVLGDALSWPEEAARFLMIWALFLAAAYALRNGEHVGLNFFVSRFHPRVTTALRMVMNVFIIGFLGVMVAGGCTEVVTLFPLKTGALRISRAVPYMIIPISGVLFILVALRLIIDDIQQLRSK